MRYVQQLSFTLAILMSSSHGGTFVLCMSENHAETSKLQTLSCMMSA